jgi:outer membrane protein TolC
VLHPIRRPLALLLVAAACAGGGCRRFTPAAADREVHGLLAARRARVPEVAGTLDVDARERLAAALRARTALRLTLRDALELAVVGSREYRRQREDVYLAALDLTGAINEFRPLFSADGSIDYSADGDGSEVDADVGLTLERAFQRGGSVVIGLASSFLKNITGSPLEVAQSILNADVVLPLLRGAGTLVARENLTQAEHDVLYALRTYARFQQEFSVDVATRFYRALQARDSWENAEARYENLQQLVDEQRERSAYTVPPFEVDQAEQDLLEADDARQRARSAFEASVDAFKLDLGIPVDAQVVFEDSDLEALRRAGPQPAPFGAERAIEVAGERRLDLRNDRDREADARRHVLVARDALRAGLDLRIGGDVSTPGDRPFDFDDADLAGYLGLDVDLPLERTAERNALRRALIVAARARRERERMEDTVVFEVRDAFRDLDQARRSYEIQVESLELAERRVESTQELVPYATVRTRDRLEAEAALARARNALTAALVDHALARLALERDVGTLRVDADGMWRESLAASPAPGDLAPPGGPPPPVVGAARGPRARPVSPDPAAPAAGDLPPPRVIPRRSGTVGTE